MRTDTQGPKPAHSWSGGNLDLSASMMCAHMTELGAEMGRLEQAGIDSYHFDVMDGHFVPNLALNAEIIGSLRPLSRRPFAVHLMVEDPTEYIAPMAKAGCDTFIFHLEASRYPGRLRREVERSGMECGIAVNPASSVASLDAVADFRVVLLMTVEPGFAGQPYIGRSADRVRAVRASCAADARIIVDGHIDVDTAPCLAAAGANVFVCGTKSVFRGTHETAEYAAALSGLRAALGAQG